MYSQSQHQGSAIPLLHQLLRHAHNLLDALRPASSTRSLSPGDLTARKISKSAEMRISPGGVLLGLEEEQTSPCSIPSSTCTALANSAAG
eukprot:3436994-Rhodomonas_salina.1